MTAAVDPQETPGVARTEVLPSQHGGSEAFPEEEPDFRNELLAALRRGPWVDLEVVLNQLEEELGRLEKGITTGRYRAYCLAKLRLALIQAQIEAAPEAYSESPKQAFYRAAKETAKFFDLIGSNRLSPNDLLRLGRHEFESIKQMIPGLAIASCQGRSPVELSVARLPAQHRMIRRIAPLAGEQQAARVLKPTRDSAVCIELPLEVARDLYYDFRGFGQRGHP